LSNCCDGDGDVRRKKLKPLLKVVSAGRQSGKVPFAPTEEQMSCCHGASLILQTYFSTLFANFRTYCLCDRFVRRFVLHSSFFFVLRSSSLVRPRVCADDEALSEQDGLGETDNGVFEGLVPERPATSVAAVPHPLPRDADLLPVLRSAPAADRRAAHHLPHLLEED
jgi:hypothetical protein